MPSKKRMRKFRMDEISSVDRPAQAPALAVITKREYDEELVKGAFYDSLKAVNIERAIWDDLWKYNDALREAIRGIFEDTEQYPDPVASVKEALGEFASAVATMVEGAVMGKNDTPFRITNKAEAQAAVTVLNLRKQSIPEELTPQIIDLLKKFGQEYTVPPVEDDSMKPEELQKSLEAAQAALEKANSIIALSADERTHFDKCDDAGKDAFLKMDAAARKAELAKVADANPVIYKALDGTEFRKNDDPRMVTMAKRADEAEKREKDEIEKRETLELTKRAEDELGNLPGEVTMKVAVLKAINGISDETTRTSALEMLKAHNTNLEPAFVSKGTAAGPDSPVNKLDALAKKYAGENSVPYSKAYMAVLETAEGKALYEQTQ